MQIIPVLDIKGGQVVRGMMGDRANYRPIETPLSRTAMPVDVARGLFGLGRFAAFYVADLDAIEGRAPNAAALGALLAAFPEMEFWLDAGVRTAAEAEALLENRQVTAVVGSETIASLATMETLSRHDRVVLSLDYRGETFVGPPSLDEDPSLWPERVIAMTLAKVGSGAGPDFGRLAGVRAMAGARRVFAAGGVRDVSDAERLQAAGISGALVASALHDGRLDGVSLSRFAP